MSVTVNTNSLSLIAQNNLNRSQSMLGTSIQRLSSGSRINSAKDDAAGQAISNRMTSQIKGMTQAARNANDGISMTQTAEGALNEISDNLQRIRELAVQAKNGSNSATDLTSIQDEVSERIAEIDRISTKTTFNGNNLLDGSAGKSGKVSFQIGSNDGDVIEIDLSKAKSDKTTLGIDKLDMNDINKDDDKSLDVIDKALAKVDAARSGLGATQNRLQSTINNLSNTTNNLAEAKSRIQDADYATEVANMSKANILQQVGTSVLAQANQASNVVLSLMR